MIIEIEHLAVAQEMLIKVMLLQDLILMQKGRIQQLVVIILMQKVMVR